MQYVSQFNGYPIKDREAREQLLEKADKTQIEELLDLINQVNELIGNLPVEAKELPFDDTVSLIGASNVQDAIDLVKRLTEKLTGSSADGVTYDNSTSGLDATDVQTALTVLKTLHDQQGTAIANLSGANISYYNSTSGLQASNVQTAIDVLKSMHSSLQTSFDNLKASNIPFVKTECRLNSTNVQDAIKELADHYDSGRYLDEVNGIDIRFMKCNDLVHIIGQVSVNADVKAVNCMPYVPNGSQYFTVNGTLASDSEISGYGHGRVEVNDAAISLWFNQAVTFARLNFSYITTGVKTNYYPS